MFWEKLFCVRVQSHLFCFRKKWVYLTVWTHLFLSYLKLAWIRKVHPWLKQKPFLKPNFEMLAFFQSYISIFFYFEVLVFIFLLFYIRFWLYTWFLKSILLLVKFLNYFFSTNQHLADKAGTFSGEKCFCSLYEQEEFFQIKLRRNIKILLFLFLCISVLNKIFTINMKINHILFSK